MNYLHLPVFLLLLFSCSHKSEEALIKETTRATEVLEKQNHSQFQRIEKLYLSDTTKTNIKGLYLQLKNIRESKEEYKRKLKENPEADFKVENKVFIEKALSQLDAEEQSVINQKFKDSPILNEVVYDDLDQNKTLSLVLTLESELITQEMFMIVLKDFQKKKTDFDWEIYW
jgi:uncharacterized protein YktA (UPF0223 family)